MGIYFGNKITWLTDNKGVEAGQHEEDGGELARHLGCVRRQGAIYWLPPGSVRLPLNLLILVLRCAHGLDEGGGGSDSDL